MLRSVPGARYTLLMSLPMTPAPTGLPLDDEAVNRRLARVFASSARDDEADAAFGITVTVRPDGGRALAAQRARMHATAVAETDPDRPRRGIAAVDPEDML